MRLLLLASILVVGMASATPVDNSAGLKAVNDGANTFSTNFLKAVTAENPGNLICSPISVDIVLAMLSLGAKDKTLQELRTGLNLPADHALFKSGYSSLMDNLNNAQNVELNLANKIFDSKTNELVPEYQSNVQSIFKSDIEKVDFGDSPGAAKTINEWAAKSTKDKIKKLFESDAFTPDTALVLANAIYFKGQWEKAFNKNATHDAPFHVDEKTVKNVPTMYKKDSFNNGISQELNARWIELPYKGGEYSLLIIVPLTINGLANVQDNMDKVNITELLNSGYTNDLDLYLPKFKIESELKLKPVLEKMGMGTMFTNDADLSGVATGGPLKVSDAIQKAYIEVNEEGTEAAAVTELELENRYGYSEITIRIDRPFVYTLLRVTAHNHNHEQNHLQSDANHTSIFVGHVEDPTLS